ncbi:MAG: hypothetical protein GXP29_14935, partial [Planctomycetes bacterium]|nr:hypothetical protein [Planctomycetota bacterium]
MTTLPTTIQEQIPLPGPLIGSMPSAPSKAITPADIISILRQRLVTIIILAILFSGMGVGLFFVLYFKFPSYRSESLIRCVSDAPKQSLEVTEGAMQDDPFTRFVQSQALFIKSYPVLSKVLKSAEVRNTSWFKSLNPDEQYLELENDLGCSAVRDTSYIRVAMSTRSIKDPAIIVNTIVQVYLDEVKERASNVYRQELNDYTREQDSYRDEVVKKNKQIQEYVATIAPGEAVENREGLGRGPLRQKLTEDQRVVQELELQVKELKSLSELYSDPTGTAVTAEDRMATEQDPRVHQYNNQVFLLEQELSLKEQQFGVNHREYRTMKARLDTVRKQLDRLRANKLRETIEFKAEQIETAYLNATNRLLTAQQALQKTEAQQADLERKISEYLSLIDERNLLIEIQNRLDEYIREIQRIVRERAAIRVSQAVPASKPLERSFPSLILLPGIVVLALASALGLAVGLELIDTSVRTSQDIVRHLNVAMLGSIPDVDDEEVEIETVETAVRDAPHSMITEAFRT